MGLCVLSSVREECVLSGRSGIVGLMFCLLARNGCRWLKNAPLVCRTFSEAVTGEM